MEALRNETMTLALRPDDGPAGPGAPRRRVEGCLRGGENCRAGIKWLNPTPARLRAAILRARIKG